MPRPPDPRRPPAAASRLPPKYDGAVVFAYTPPGARVSRAMGPPGGCTRPRERPSSLLPHGRPVSPLATRRRPGVCAVANLAGIHLRFKEKWSRYGAEIGTISPYSPILLTFRILPHQPFPRGSTVQTPRRRAPAMALRRTPAACRYPALLPHPAGRRRRTDLPPPPPSGPSRRAPGWPRPPFAPRSAARRTAGKGGRGTPVSPRRRASPSRSRARRSSAPPLREIRRGTPVPRGASPPHRRCRSPR